MPRVLTVDDSRAIRQIVSKQLADLGCETDEAEDGEKGLERLKEAQFDLVLLDVTMPVMDGPEMLRRLRESGNQTPVIMLTSESKRSVVAGALRLGIVEYILKPFKPEELRAKVQKVIRLDVPAATAGVVASATSSAHGVSDKSRAAGRQAAASAGKPFIDVLVIDDMENVQKKLRTLLPAHLSLDGATNATAALNLCREKVYRLVLLDTVIPEVNSVALMNQLRALQAHTMFLALMLRSASDAAQEVRAHGYDGHLFKPFDAMSIDDLLVRYFEDQELMTLVDNVLSAAAFVGRDDRLDKYFGLLHDVSRVEIEKVAAACHDEVIVDLTLAPLRPDKMTRFLIDLRKQAGRMGIGLRVVGLPELRRLIGEFTDTSNIPFFASVSEAQAGKAA
jgi:two-component system cell cycle response regulator